jgi:hypothetical protein
MDDVIGRKVLKVERKREISNKVGMYDGPPGRGFRRS